MTARTVTDLETTALDLIVFLGEGHGTKRDYDNLLAAVRELARRATAKQYPDGPLSPYDAACLRADEAEADRDQWRNHYTAAEAKVEEVEADRDRLQAERDDADTRWGRVRQADQYREALEQINHFPFDVNKTAPEDLMAIKEVARAALATPDTPPDA